jgi:hypothetical protein
VIARWIHLLLPVLIVHHGHVALLHLARLNSYKLRFKQALAATLGIDLSDKSTRIEKDFK